MDDTIKQPQDIIKNEKNKLYIVYMKYIRKIKKLNESTDLTSDELRYSINNKKNNLDDFILTAIKNTSIQLEDVQRDQMQVGENSEGNTIGKLRDADYAKRKKAKGGIAKLGVVDLKNTGDFYDAIFAKVESKFIEISSSDFKSAAFSIACSAASTSWFNSFCIIYFLTCHYEEKRRSNLKLQSITNKIAAP